VKAQQMLEAGGLAGKIVLLADQRG
jgi:hypothetical protein